MVGRILVGESPQVNYIAWTHLNGSLVGEVVVFRKECLVEVDDGHDAHVGAAMRVEVLGAIVEFLPQI